MSLGTDVAAALPYLRAEAESRMTETVRVYTVQSVRADGAIGVTDTQTVLHEGIARLKFTSTVVSDQETAGQLIAVQDLQLHLPIGSDANVAVDATAEIIASTADASLVGRKFRIKGMPQGGQTTARRWPLEEIR